MKQQHAGGDGVFRRAQARAAVTVEAFEHLLFADHRQVVPGGRIEIQSTFLDQLQHRRGGDRFRRGKQGEDAVGGHFPGLTECALARSALIDQAVTPGDGGDHARHAQRSGGDGIEQVVE
ncbi:hypothetical protein D3C87_1724370 [compost metagenome]